MMPRLLEEHIVSKFVMKIASVRLVMHDKIDSSIGWRIWTPLEAVWYAWTGEWVPATVSAKGVPASPTGRHCPNLILVFIKITQKNLEFIANFIHRHHKNHHHDHKISCINMKFEVLTL